MSALSVEIDPHAGFCGGVIRAISSAEGFLDAHPGGKLYSLGAIVHNEEELSRLGAKGLETVNLDSLETIAPGGGVPVLIRAHGEPPKTYERAAAKNYEVLDCTCPVVLKLQKDIRKAYLRLRPTGGQLIIFGRVGHAEVLGLLGQVDGDALVVESEAMLEEMLSEGKIRTGGPIEIFSQTTKSPDGYARLCERLRAAMADPSQLSVHDTICTQVARRHESLSSFARSHDVILFVTGKESSNGAVLSELCRSFNPRTYRISSPQSIEHGWFRPGDSVGVSGATSTPKWLLEQVAAFVSSLKI